MNILIFVRSLAVGGTERQVPLLARGLASRGHRVTVAMLYAGGAMENALSDQLVKLVAARKRGRWDLLGPLWRLLKIMRAERPDVVYAFLPMQNVLAALLRPLVGTRKLVFGVRGSAFRLASYDHLSALSYRAEAWLSRCADAVIANSSSFLADAESRNYARGRTCVVPNGIDVAAMRIDRNAGRRMRQVWGIGEQAFVVGLVARLDPMKDHRNFLHAAAAFARTNPDAHFVCVGGGDAGNYRRALEAQVSALGLSDRVLFAGEQRDLISVYNAFDIGTLSSVFGEGFPNVVGEAMACGIPMAVTDVGDAAMIVGPYGISVPPGNSELLAAAWAQLRTRLAAEPDLGAQARAHIALNFGVDAMVQATEGILARVCALRTGEGA